MMKAATKYRDEISGNISYHTNLASTRIIRRLTFEVKCYNKGITEETSEFD